MKDSRIFSPIEITLNHKKFCPVHSLTSQQLYEKVHELSFELSAIVNELNERDKDDIVSNVVRSADSSLYALLVCLNQYV